ncbi:MAG: DegT/DnrJ/EryC1/StrS family aminotransferase [Armatimonadetes bacterium]|nr:DegT/DnrJ/EryC1/StrS family aminotransferase [Armatimonadota bacterium]MDW8121139.1 DegT/DnrJ/EryC1/StrS family aminotransferase [Armatimonadota bacterium]
MGVLAIAGGRPIRTAPYPSWPMFTDEEWQALRQVVESGQWWGRTPGSRVEAFEEAFARYQQAPFCVACTNGTIGIYLALKGAGVKPGEEVIVPPYTFIATATAVLDVGAVPVFADIEESSLNLDPQDVANKITPRTTGIVAVHIGGRPADMDALKALAERHHLILIEDCAQAHGASWKNRRVGALGTAGSFSFQASKNITAGEGGAVTTADRQIYESVWSLHNCGRSLHGARYDHFRVGGNHRMTEWQAAILLVQLQRADQWHQKRQRNAAYLNSLLRELEIVEPVRDDPRITENAYHLYIFRYRQDRLPAVSRQRFLEGLRAEGIPVSPGYKPLYREPAFSKASLDDHPFARYYDYSRVVCPVTEKVCRDEAVWLTQNVLLAEPSDLEDVARAIAKIRDNYRELLN